MNGMVSSVQIVEVESESAGQRIDNFLSRRLKGVPKSCLYRVLRRGEVRVNGGRVRAKYRLEVGDRVRIPPLRTAVMEVPCPPVAIQSRLLSRVVLETSEVLVLNKPSGIAVHGGSGIRWGVIEAMRAARSDLPRIELVHRLDRETSGCLILSKDTDALRSLHASLRERLGDKRYLALVRGHCDNGTTTVNAPLRRFSLKGGERMVEVSGDGRPATTHFRTIRAYADCSLVEASIETGRTHQIRVHAAHIGHPVAGDSKYGDEKFNRGLARRGLRRLFLHAHSVSFDMGGRQLDVDAPLDRDLKELLDRLETSAPGRVEEPMDGVR